MNRKYYSALAVSLAAVGMVLLTSNQASAHLVDPPTHTTQPTQNVAPGWPDEGSGYPSSVEPKKGYRYAPYLPDYAMAPTKTTAAAASSSDDTSAEWLQSGASALGGAAIALSGVWLYRRRQLHAA